MLFRSRSHLFQGEEKIAQLGHPQNDRQVYARPHQKTEHGGPPDEPVDDAVAVHDPFHQCCRFRHDIFPSLPLQSDPGICFDAIRRHNEKFECSAAAVPPFVRAEISKNKQEKNSSGVIIASSDSCRCRGIVRGTSKRAEDRSVLRQGPTKVQDALVPGAPAGQTQAPLGDEERPVHEDVRGVQQASPEKYELHRLLVALVSKKLTTSEKLEIIEKEYKIPVNDNLRKDVNVMCNLSQGIVDETKIEVMINVVMNMHKNKFSLEQISLATNKSIEEVKKIIEENEPVLA